jgi:hypothetical protein
MLFKQPQVAIPVSHQSGSSEWWTPPQYADMARKVMGGIDLDPASCAGANENIRATQFYNICMDGLVLVWFGCIWLNPPYTRGGTGSAQARFIKKMMGEWKAERIEQTIVLLNANSIASGWFTPLHDFPIYIKRSPRIEFIPATESPNRKSRTSRQRQRIRLSRTNISTFVETFKTIGPVFTRTKIFSPTRQHQEVLMSDIPIHVEHAKKPDGQMPPGDPPVAGNEMLDDEPENFKAVGPKLVHDADAAPAETETERAAREAAEEDADEREFLALRRDLPETQGASAAGVVAINVGKTPAKDTFFRVHPTFRPITKLLTTAAGMDLHYYTATDEMEHALATIGIPMHFHTLYFTKDEEGAYKIVPVRCPDEDGAQNEYSRTKELAMIRGTTEWLRIYTDLKNQVYKIFPAPKDRFSEPVWLSLPHSKIFRLAFRDKEHCIDSFQHPLYLRRAALRAADSK